MARPGIGGPSLVLLIPISETKSASRCPHSVQRNSRADRGNACQTKMAGAKMEDIRPGRVPFLTGKDEASDYGVARVVARRRIGHSRIRVDTGL
jgi:hypothetical protein